MTVGTQIVSHSTVASPVTSRIEQGIQRPLASTIGVLRFPKDTVINRDYKLQVDLIVEIKIEDDKYVVFDYQINEYGIGNSLEEARRDLLESLVDYLASLEKREHRLATRELHNLQLLRSMLARV